MFIDNKSRLEDPRRDSSGRGCLIALAVVGGIIVVIIIVAIIFIYQYGDYLKQYLNIENDTRQTEIQKDSRMYKDENQGNRARKGTGYRDYQGGTDEEERSTRGGRSGVRQGKH